MPKIVYEPWAPRFARDQELIDTIDVICTDFARRGYSATLRQVYYALVSRAIIPNTVKSYDRLGRLVSDARRAGMIDWSHIIDRERNLGGNTHWRDPAEIIRGAARGYGIDTWSTQPTRVEVWVEKNALVDVVAQACRPWDVDFFPCKGYVSDSEIWAAGRRFQSYVDYDGQNVVLLHCGDHDPSGIDMTRDVEERLHLLTNQKLRGSSLEVRRIALNMDQIEQYQPPPNPAKTTDVRFAGYQELYGTDSWELDALDPDVLRGIIDDAIASIVDMDALEARREQQDSERDQLQRVVDHWQGVVRFLNGYYDTEGDDE